MADRVINLLREPERMRAMGVKARKTVEENFSCESQLRITEELYEKYLKRTRSSS
jgi:glycosyltransferase involved in cell wall biosynthesis